MPRVKLLVLLFTFVSPVYETGERALVKRVVAIAIDGVREVDARPTIEVLRQKMEELGLHTFFRGKQQGCIPSQGTNFSLPAYATLFSGKVQADLRDNYFNGTLIYKSLFDEYPDSQLFSAWPSIQKAVSNDVYTLGRVFIAGVGHKPYEDEYVMASFRLLHNFENRLTFIHLGDADEFAHLGRWREYNAAIESEANYIHEIVQTSEIHAMKETVYFVFTDHGRGEKVWQRHGPSLPESHTMWVLEISPFEKSTLGASCNHIAIHDAIRMDVGKP
ncbi:MAG TPA: hypothetical protein PLY93_01510 [Turneriella sp.]|nr:hypothetical protein [Turneriella sp.]